MDESAYLMMGANSGRGFDVVAHRGQRLPGTLAATTLFSLEPVRVKLQEPSRDFRIQRVILTFVIEILQRCMVPRLAMSAAARSFAGAPPSRSGAMSGSLGVSKSPGIDCCCATADLLVAASVRVQGQSRHQNLQRRPLRRLCNRQRPQADGKKSNWPPTTWKY